MTVAEIAKAVSFALSRRQSSLLARFSEQAIKWNKSVRITGSRNEEQFIRCHVADGLEVAKEVQSLGPSSLVDVGAGAGLPSIILAIVFPDLQVTAVEPIQKKCSFMNRMKHLLELDNFSVFVGTDDDYTESDQFQTFDVAVSRATWPAVEWVKRSQRLLSAGGTTLALEGQTRAINGSDFSREYEVDGKNYLLHHVKKTS